MLLFSSFSVVLSRATRTISPSMRPLRPSSRRSSSMRKISPSGEQSLENPSSLSASSRWVASVPHSTGEQSRAWPPSGCENIHEATEEAVSHVTSLPETGEKVCPALANRRRR